MGLIKNVCMRSLMFSLVCLLDISVLIEQRRSFKESFFCSNMEFPGKTAVNGQVST